MSGSLLEHLADFGHEVSLERVPARVVEEARYCVLDTVGCIVAGLDEPAAAMLLAAELAGQGPPEATTFGGRSKLPAESAARVNAYLGDILELHDLISGHASIASVPAALALAERERRAGREFLEAVIVGIEVTAHVYTAFYPTVKDFTDVAIAPPGIPSTIGVAAAAAKLMKLDRARTRAALAIAGTLAGWFPIEAFVGDGGSVKPLLQGAWPGSTGLLAARYAAHGLTGPRELLESKVGFYATVARSYDRDVVRATDTWYLERPRRKLHACCGFIHAAIDTVAAMRRERQVDFGAVRAIRIGVPAYTIPTISKRVIYPESPEDARFHLGYCVALAARGIDTFELQHTHGYAEYLKQPGLRELIGKVSVHADPAARHFADCTVETELAAGAVTRLSGRKPRGSPENPLTPAELEQKFRGLVGRRLARIDCDAFIARTLKLEREPMIDWIAGAFAPRA